VGGWHRALAPEQLRHAVHDNLDNLGLGALDVVNLRIGGGHDGLARAAAALTLPQDQLAKLDSIAS
jgi:pyridoxine 4-dehydrogenase